MKVKEWKCRGLCFNEWLLRISTYQRKRRMLSTILNKMDARPKNARKKTNGRDARQKGYNNENMDKEREYSLRETEHGEEE